MRRSTRKRYGALAALAGAAVVLVPALSAPHAEDAAQHSFLPPGIGEAAGLPSSLRLHAVVARAWDDSLATWTRLMAPQAGEVAMVSLQLVRRLAPRNCYGLYAGEGPAYCSGNHTVFVGTKAASQLMAKFGPNGEAAIAFLIGHEIGHHIQNINGRFQMLNYMLARLPGSRGDLVRRFELEADCYAGVWMHASRRWSSSPDLRSRVRAVLANIGDDSVLAETPGAKISEMATHGTSAQRSNWFMRGVERGSLDACNTFLTGEL